MTRAIDTLRRMIDESTASVAQLLRRGLVRVASAAGRLQVEGYEGEHFDDVELWQAFGLASRPLAGGEVLLAQIDDQGEQAIAFAAHDRAHQPADLAAGEAVLYGAKVGAEQAQVRARADGSVDLVAVTGETVNVGGDDEAMLLGETVQADIIAFATDLTSANLAAHAATLVTAAADWLSSKAKLS